jgi:hypothetical protein
VWPNVNSGNTLDASLQAESGTGLGTSYVRLICPARHRSAARDLLSAPGWERFGRLPASHVTQRW